MDAHDAPGNEVISVRLSICHRCGYEQRLTVVTASVRQARCFRCGDTSRTDVAAESPAALPGTAE